MKPKFWDNRKISLFSILLYPLTFIIDLRTFFLGCFKKKVSFKKIKTICVGNIYIGGTGKTPLTEFLANELKKKHKTVIIKKKYLSHFDEKILLEKNNEVIFEKNRLNSLDIALKKKFKIAVFDDGLQDYNIDYDLKIACFSSNNLAGNQLRIPSGPLRERINNIKNYDAVFINGEKNNKIKKFSNYLKTIKSNIKIFRGIYVANNAKHLKKQNFLTFSGIGNPDSFKNTLKKYGIKFEMNIIFPDHYIYSLSDIQKIKRKAKMNNLKILTTEKDFCRIKKEYRKDIQFLKINLEILEISKFRKFIKSFI